MLGLMASTSEVFKNLFGDGGVGVGAMGWERYRGRERERQPLCVSHSLSSWLAPLQSLSRRGLKLFSRKELTCSYRWAVNTPHLRAVEDKVCSLTLRKGF